MILLEKKSPSKTAAKFLYSSDISLFLLLIGFSFFYIIVCLFPNVRYLPVLEKMIIITIIMLIIIIFVLIDHVLSQTNLICRAISK